MATDTRSYWAELEVEFDIEPGTDFINWVNPETGETQHRMTGIYPNIVTEEDIKKHWAYNLLVNGVSDASRLDGWADLPKGAITMRVVYSTFQIEEV